MPTNVNSDNKASPLEGRTPTLREIKEAMIAVRLPAETKTGLEQMAREDFRTLSSLIEKILTEAARAKGYLKKHVISESAA